MLSDIAVYIESQSESPKASPTTHFPLVIYKNQIKCKTIFQYFYSNWCFVKAAEDASKKQIKSTADQQQQQQHK